MKKIIVFLLTFVIFCCPVFVYAADYVYQTRAPVTYPMVLMYHQLTNNGEEGSAFGIPQSVFESDIKKLKDMGYEFLNSTELTERLKSRDFSQKSVMITFDDGYSSDLELALPILEKYDAKATFFVIGSMVGTDGYMTKEQIKTLSRSPHAEIGNHSYSIHNLSVEELKKMYFSMKAVSANQDFIKNKQFLEEITKKPVAAISYPYGLVGKYINSLVTQHTPAVFCSNEAAVTNEKPPYNRFNRPVDTTIEKIIAKTQQKSGVIVWQTNTQ